MKKTKYHLSSSKIIENSIAFHLFQYGELTAKQIQERLGLKRQTTYNYLKKLEKDKKVKIRFKYHPKKSNVKIAYYSYTKANQPKEYKIQLKSFYEGRTDKEILDLLNDQIDLTIASLFEAKIFLNNRTSKELKQIIENTPIGPGIDNLSLSDEEFEELGAELNSTLAKVWKRWLQRKPKPGRNHFIIGGFRAFY